MPATDGTVAFKGQDFDARRGASSVALRRDMQIVFQDPFSSLNPRMTIGQHHRRGLLVHGMRHRRKERFEMVAETLRKVGLDPSYANRYPHEFSGGQRQRIGIARALALIPSSSCCDEPVSALDVSIQSQILNLLNDLQRERNLTYLFIAHNLAVVEHISDRVAVMYLGKMVELADRDELYRNPLHPYTQALLSAIPTLEPVKKKLRIVLPGDVPSPINPPSGCRFHPRCQLRAGAGRAVYLRPPGAAVGGCIRALHGRPATFRGPQAARRTGPRSPLVVPEGAFRSRPANRRRSGPRFGRVRFRRSTAEFTH